MGNTSKILFRRGAGAVCIAVCLLIGLLWCAEPTPLHAAPDETGAAQDKLLLQQWNPREDGIIPLDGPWDFYWHRLLAPGDLADGGPSADLSVTIPAQWNDYVLDEQALPNEGYATYRMKFVLSDAASSQSLGLYFNNVASAYRFWINGEPMGGSGTVGADANRMVPRSNPRIYFFVPKSGDNEIVIQVSNFAQRTGGIWETVDLGDAEQVASLYRNRVMTWTFVAGSLLLMSIFSVFLYLFRRKEVAALWFGLICLAICIRSSLLAESYAYVLFPGLSWEWGVKLEYLSEIVTIFSIAAFVEKQYPLDAVRRLFPVFGTALAVFGVFVLATPAKVYTQYMVPYILLLLLPVFLYVMYVYIRAALRRRSGSRTNIIGFAGFFFSVIHEVLYYTGFVPFGGLLYFGLLFFLLTQLLNLSFMFTNAITRSEFLFTELNKVIESQEETIKARTSSLEQLNLKLEQGNRELSRIEHVRSSLMAEVYHDLSTPITSIKGFSKAIMTGVIAEDVPQYAKRIYERSLLLEKLIDDFVDLSQLKTGEIQFQLSENAIVPLLRQLSHKYEAEAGARGIALIWEEPPAWLPAGKEIRVNLDPFRFERVFANLVSNAVKFTPEGGAIRVRVQFVPDADVQEGRVIVHVIDTGIGIPETDLIDLFKRRARNAGTKRVGAGSGLGLAICAEIIARHSGEIGVHSKIGEGSDFFITLPAKVRDAEGGAHEYEHTAN